MPAISSGFVNVQIMKNIESILLEWTRQKYHLFEEYCLCDCVAKIPVFCVMAGILANLNAHFCTFHDRSCTLKSPSKMYTAKKYSIYLCAGYCYSASHVHRVDYAPF